MKSCVFVHILTFCTFLATLDFQADRHDIFLTKTFANNPPIPPRPLMVKRGGGGRGKGHLKLLLKLFFYLQIFSFFNVLLSEACFMMLQISGKLRGNITIKNSNVHQYD